MDIMDSLREKIKQEQTNKLRAIVFWYDPTKHETSESLQLSLQGEDVLVRVLTTTNFIKLKYEIEFDKPNDSFLLYAPFARPRDEENYLLDMLLYGAEFKADEVAALAEQMQLEDAVIRPLYERYTAFFLNKERVQKMRRILPARADVQMIEAAMVAVLVGSPSPHTSNIVRHLLLSGLNESTNEAYRRVDKFFSLDRMWELVLRSFGIPDENRLLRSLLEHLLYFHFQLDAKGMMKTLSERYVSSLPNLCALFVDDWMRGFESEQAALEDYLKETEGRFEINSHLREHGIDLFDRTKTFPVTEMLIIEKAVDELLHQTADLLSWKERIAFRLTTYWGKKERIAALYRVLYEAITLTEQKALLKKYQALPQWKWEWLKAYADELYVIDQTYRRMMTAYTNVENPEIVATLVDQLTNWYENVYLMQLAEQTNRWLETEGNNTTGAGQWLLQRLFFAKQIRPILEKETTRVFVIISDALRYEVGEELKNLLNRRANGEASITPMQVALPSYTQLGMASLLPHRTLTVDEKGTVYADDMSTRGLANRDSILKNAHPDAAAYRLHELMDWSREVAEENLKGKRVIYLYHDVIDATGDSTKTERETYEAVERTIHTLERAVDRLSRLRAKRIFITADHGFLFQFKKIEADAKIQTVSGTVYDRNRRFALGTGLSVPEGAIRLEQEDTLLRDSEVVVAKGLNRFSGSGGLQFIHGGAMPQEIVVPLVEYRRTEKANLVDVSVAMRDKVITNHRVNVTLYQDQKVSSDFLPRQVKMAFYQEQKRISNEVIMTFGFTGEAMQRNESVIFTLGEHPFEMGEVCTLKIETIEENRVLPYKDERFTIRMYEALY